MSASDEQVTKKGQKVIDDQSAGCSEIFNSSPQLLLYETLSTDSKQTRETHKAALAAERKRLYRERHREECKQRQQRYYDKHKEELNKRKREKRRELNGSPSAPATPAERNRKYRQRNKQIINERRRLQRNSQPVHGECNMNNLKSTEQIKKTRVKNRRTSGQGHCEEISTVFYNDPTPYCVTSEVRIKIEPDTDGFSTEEQSEQNGVYANSLHEEIQIKLEPEIKLEVLEPPEELPDTECPLFEPCTRRMLPRVGMFAIVQYLIQHGLFYDLLDFDKLKEDNEDLYADDTIHHVQIHKNKATVILQCTVAFNRTTSHTCLMKYNVYTKCIEHTRCECGQQACEHIIALLMWAHRRAEERIDNDMPL